MTLKHPFRSLLDRFRKKRPEADDVALAKWSSPTINVRLTVASEDVEASFKETAARYENLFFRLADWDSTNQAPPVDDGFVAGRPRKTD